MCVFSDYLHQKYELIRQAANIGFRAVQLYIDAGDNKEAKQLLYEMEQEIRYDVPRQQKWNQLMSQVS